MPQSGKMPNCLSSCLMLMIVLALCPGVPLSAQPLPTGAGQSVRVDSELSIPMRDGTTLSADIYRPDTAGQYPVLYVATPYPRNADGPWRDQALLAHYVARGYAIAVVNVRGTGQSGGDYGFLGREEQQDHYEVIAWIREQDWANGQVGGFGSGYAATAQWLAALQQPPGLACIAPVEGVLSPYHDWAFPGGVASERFVSDWYENRLRIPHAFPAEAEGTPRLLPLDMRLSMMEHRLFDSWWQARDARQRLSQLQVPAFIIRRWDSRSPGTASALQAPGLLRVQHRTLVLGADSPGFSDSAFHDRELLPFYDWCLKNDNPRFIERPELRYEVPGRTLEKRDSRWPPGDAEYVPLFPDPDNSHMGFDRPANAPSLALAVDEQVQFSTGRLQAPLDINGPLMLSLTTASNTRDLALEVRLLERRLPGNLPAAEPELPDFLAPESGTEADSVATEPEAPTLISRGVLKLSARAEDDASSGEYQPRYAGTASSPVLPGRSYDVRIAMQPVARRFLPGTELILELRQVRDPALQQLQPTAQIQMDAGHRPRLWLPMTRGRDAIAPPGAMDNRDPQTDGLSDLLFDSDSAIIPAPGAGTAQ